MNHSGVDGRYAWIERPEVLERLRWTFRSLNRSMVLMWRLGLGPVFGRFPSTAGRILVIHHVGRKSGTVYQSPVNYAVSHGSLFCVAAFGSGSDWYKNLMAQPSVEVWLPDGPWMVEVSDANERPDRLDRLRDVLISSGFAAPTFGLHPTRMTDEELAEATEDYRLLEIVKREEIPQSVADLSWAWVIAVVAVLGIARRSRR